jgi:glycosyltransferase involved in cell wall biosynthesis
MKNPKLVFWWSNACRSIMPLLRELAQTYDPGVRIIVEQELGPNRQKFGWKADSSGNAQLDVLPEQHSRRAIERILLEEADSLHIIGGYQRLPLHRYAISFAQARGISYGIMAEAPANLSLGFKRIAKDVYLKTALRLKTAWIVDKSNFFICLSGRRYDSVINAGWPLDKIYPFGYFPEYQSDAARQRRGSNGACRFICMGALLNYKGVDILLHAFSMARRLGAAFVADIVGDGAERLRLQALATDLGLEDCVTFHGFVSDSALNQIIALSDVLVCPGKVEPWGIRVNEGLQRGLAIICSDRLGASELISASGAGILFRSGDAGELAEAVHTLARNQELVELYQQRSIDYAPQIHPKKAAQHLIQIIEHATGHSDDRPLALWQATSKAQLIM